MPPHWASDRGGTVAIQPSVSSVSQGLFGAERTEAGPAGSTPIFQIKHADSSRVVFAMPYVSDSHSKSGVDPKLTFECGEGHCTLVKMDSGTGATYKFRRPSLGADEPIRLAVVRAVLVNSR
jgi:hypothetical protein